MPTTEIDINALPDLVGQEVAVSDWFEVTQDHINQFADLTKDHQWIHVDTDRAKAESPYGTTIAHGFLTLSLMSHLVSSAVKVTGQIDFAVNYGFNKVRFPAPVPAGANIRARVTLQSIEPVKGGLQIVWNANIEVKDNPKPAVAAEWIARMYGPTLNPDA